MPRRRRTPARARRAGGVALWLIVALAAVAATWISAIGQAAVVAGAAQRMDGLDPTLGSVFDAARSRLGRLLEWAVLATVVSIVFDQLEQRLGVFGRIAAGSAASPSASCPAWRCR